MAAPAVFPWLRVGVETAARYLAGLPLVDDAGHPLGGLLRTRDRLGWWVSEIVAEEVWALRQSRSYLHPAIGLVRDGVAIGYQAPDGREVLTPIEWHAGLTLSGSPNNRGTSAVKALEAMLNTEWSVDRLSAKAAKRGHVSYIGTAKNDQVRLSDRVKAKLYAEWDKVATAGMGLFLLDEAFELKPAAMSFRDMEFQAAVSRAQAAALALMHIPPVMSGIPSAGYGESRQQMRGFWGYYRERSKSMDAFLSAVYGRPIRHDFRHIDALQAAETERLNRAKTMASAPLGYSPSDAMLAQGYPSDVAARAGRHAAAGLSGRPPGPQGQPQDRLSDALADAGRRWTLGVTDRETEATALRAALLVDGLHPALAKSVAEDEARLQEATVRAATARGISVSKSAIFARERAIHLRSFDNGR